VTAISAAPSARPQRTTTSPLGGEASIALWRTPSIASYRGQHRSKDDRMWDPTSTSRLGVTVTPRRPGFDFEGLEHEVPRAWHPAGIGPTAFLEALSAMAPVVEGFFIDDTRRLLPRIAEERPRAEGEAFLRQEAAHASMHAALGPGLHTYALRIAGLWIAVVLLALALPSVSYRILASAGAAQDLHAWRGLIHFVFGRGGMLRGRWRAVAAYHRRDFHPWRYLDNRRFLSELRDTIVDPAWEGRAR